MKKGIHPDYQECTVRCGCGASWETFSTQTELKIEVCSSCHPFYTGGDDRTVDLMGRVDRFQKKFGGDYFKKSSKRDRTKRR